MREKRGNFSQPHIYCDPKYSLRCLPIPGSNTVRLRRYAAVGNFMEDNVEKVWGGFEWVSCRAVNNSSFPLSFLSTPTSKLPTLRKFFYRAKERRMGINGGTET